MSQHKGIILEKETIQITNKTFYFPVPGKQTGTPTQQGYPRYSLDRCLNEHAWQHQPVTWHRTSFEQYQGPICPRTGPDRDRIIWWGRGGNSTFCLNENIFQSKRIIDGIGNKNIYNDIKIFMLWDTL